VFGRVFSMLMVPCLTLTAQPTVYQLAIDRLSLNANAICLVSSNGWDAYSAKAFGFHVIWCNRSGQAPERIPEAPDAEIRTLSDLPEIIGVASHHGIEQVHND